MAHFLEKKKVLDSRQTSFGPIIYKALFTFCNYFIWSRVPTIAFFTVNLKANVRRN